MGIPGYRGHSSLSWDPAAPVDPAEAEEFLCLLHQEHPGLGPVRPRLDRVRREIAETGTYTHTPEELAFGARVAWRNASRCIGRLYWRSLLVRDLRGIREPEAVFAELVRHLENAAAPPDDRHGPRTARRIRPVISVFDPAAPGTGTPVRVWNDQLIRYAGYRNTDGTVVGDPRYVEFTESVTALGWRGRGGRFDVLPLVIESPRCGPRLFDLPAHAVVEVPLAHPSYPWFARLGLRWHAVPAISNMRLSIGGVNYPLAPFNGWYMGTEIGARNLADPDRYHQLPVIAARLGLDTTTETTLWRDRALVELNRAVLWSFERAGIRISDHHTESRRFLDHIAKEHRAGRPTPADWTWIVPPISGAATPVFHRYYHEADLRPNFYLDAEAAHLAHYGRGRATVHPAGHAATCPVTGQANGRTGPRQQCTRPVTAAGIASQPADPAATVTAAGIASQPAAPADTVAIPRLRPAVPGGYAQPSIQ
ncbi:nitric oxide synthase oxygenase [Planosporangium sp. 12N6]|uniref:nitric oxide synthase oxygenase n=1 Tax=Planosporangium spinosum TaxID=3402278 RepID=UPI003CF999C1